MPPNTTAVLQPVDVGVGKSLKSFVKNEFHNWVIKSHMKIVKKNGQMIQTFKNPTKEMIIEWILKSKTQLEKLRYNDSTKSILIKLLTLLVFDRCGLVGDEGRKNVLKHHLRNHYLEKTLINPDEYLHPELQSDEDDEMDYIHNE